MNDLNLEVIDFGSTQFIDRVLQLYPDLNLEDLVNLFLKSEENKSLKFVEEDGIDSTYGYIAYMTKKDIHTEPIYASFSDKFISLDNSYNVDLNFNWINLIYDKLRQKTQHEANDYLINVSETIDMLEDCDFNKEDIDMARKKLQAVSFGVYSKSKPIMSEAEIIMFMHQNCD